LKKTDEKTLICGPYWTSLWRVYDIGLGDVLEFEYDPDPIEGLDNLFHVTISSNGVEKYIHEAPCKFLLTTTTNYFLNYY